MVSSQPSGVASWTGPSPNRRPLPAGDVEHPVEPPDTRSRPAPHGAVRGRIRSVRSAAMVARLGAARRSSLDELDRPCASVR